MRRSYDPVELGKLGGRQTFNWDVATNLDVLDDDAFTLFKPSQDAVSRLMYLEMLWGLQLFLDDHYAVYGGFHCYVPFFLNHATGFFGTASFAPHLTILPRHSNN